MSISDLLSVLSFGFWLASVPDMHSAKIKTQKK